MKISYLAKILELISSYLIVYLILTYLGAVTYGIYAVFNSVVSVVASIIQIGLPTYILVALNYRNGHLIISTRKLLTEASVFIGWAILVIILCSVIVSNAYGSRPYEDSYFTFLAISTAAILSLLTVTTSILRAAENQVVANVIDQLSKNSLLLIVMLFAIATKLGVNEFNLMLTVSISLTLFLIVSVFFITRIKFRTTKYKVSQSRGRFTSQISSLALLTIALSMFRNVDTIIIGSLLEPLQTSSYRLGVLIGSIPVLIYGVIVSLEMPRMRQLKTVSTKKLKYFTKCLFVVNLSITLAFGVAGKQLVELLFPEVSALDVQIIGLIFLIGNTINLLFGFNFEFLLMQNKIASLFFPVAMTLLLLVLVNVLLVLLIGSAGAAIGTVLSLIAFSTIIRSRVKQEINTSLGVI